MIQSIFQRVNEGHFILVPLWIAGLVESQHEPLFEIPVIQPKDTWFGPNAQQGEICYATSVDGRTDLNLLTPRAFRAVTPIDFHNTSNHQLRFDRMNVPVTALPLFIVKVQDAYGHHKSKSTMKALTAQPVFVLKTVLPSGR